MRLRMHTYRSASTHSIDARRLELDIAESIQHRPTQRCTYIFTNHIYIYTISKSGWPRMAHGMKFFPVKPTRLMRVPLKGAPCSCA